MFAAIAPRYDLLNKLLSFGQDARWRRVLARSLPPTRPGDRVLDLCTGTGDVAHALARAGGAGLRVVGADFCEPMLALAPGKRRRGEPGVPFVAADAMALPFHSASFRALTVAFGLRNVEDPQRSLHEMARVLAPGGRLLILEFGRPEQKAFAALYRTYFFRIVPKVGKLVSGHDEAYRYLPESVWAFQDATVLAGALRQAGLTVIEQRPLMFGAVRLHLAERPLGA